MQCNPFRAVPCAGFLTRLARDRRGNVLAMMAAFMIPLAALAGSAVDIARLYTVKTRLQQACDAGVLAGRKSMTNNTIDTSENGQAQSFFKNNFRTGWFGTQNVAFTPSVTSDFQVAGKATADVPMTITTMFGQTTQTLVVTCQARYDVADTDIMFVLDTTGSMACAPADVNGCGPTRYKYTRSVDGTVAYANQEKSGSKIAALRSAVLSFYDTMADTADSSTHIRYGFVPYTMTANVGYLLQPSHMVNSWAYQSRQAVGDKVLKTNSSSNAGAMSQSSCMANYSRNPAVKTITRPDGTNGKVYAYAEDGTASAVTPVWSSANGGSCTLNRDTVIPVWRYQQWTYDVSVFKTGVSVADPTRVAGPPSKWQGCVEERSTRSSSSFDTGNVPPDLDPDTVPNTDDTKWRPLWPDVVYYRGNNPDNVDFTGNGTNPYGDVMASDTTPKSTDYTSMLLYQTNAQNAYSCPKRAQRLAVMSRGDVAGYVNADDFKAQGNTYHDAGMIWGLRLISPTGLFADDTSAWPGRQPPNRYIVFMTDGALETDPNDYGLYGIERYDRRIVGNDSPDGGTMTSYHNSRFVAECQVAKSKNITVFVVAFGKTLNSQLSACASPGQAYYAADSGALQTAFQRIASQVASLRISK
jgi:Flp pilus assembly protein TadG